MSIHMIASSSSFVRNCFSDMIAPVPATCIYCYLAPAAGVQRTHSKYDANYLVGR